MNNLNLLDSYKAIEISACCFKLKKYEEIINKIQTSQKLNKEDVSMINTIINKIQIILTKLESELDFIEKVIIENEDNIKKWWKEKVIDDFFKGNAPDYISNFDFFHISAKNKKELRKFSKDLENSLTSLNDIGLFSVKNSTESCTVSRIMMSFSIATGDLTESLFTIDKAITMIDSFRPPS